MIDKNRDDSCAEVGYSAVNVNALQAASVLQFSNNKSLVVCALLSFVQL